MSRQAKNMELSRYCSVLDLYNIIKENHIEGLKKAIFYLGINIHNIKLWKNLNAMFYAAQLGHIEQTDLLLKEHSNMYPGALQTHHLQRLLLVASTETQKQFVKSLAVKIFPDESQGDHHSLIQTLVLEKKFDFLETLVKECCKDTLISMIIHYGFLYRKKEIFRSCPTIQSHPEYTHEIVNFKSDRLTLAILQGDKNAMRLCLEERTRTEAWEDWFDITETIAMIDDSEILDYLLENSPMDYILQLTDWQEMLMIVVDQATSSDSSEVLSAILNNRKFGQDLVNWSELYHKWVYHGWLKCAEVVKHLVDFDDQNAKDSAFEEAENLKMDSHMSVEEFMRKVDTAESLQREKPKNDSRWRQNLKIFPIRNRRPDLVEPLQKYSDLDMSITVSDVLSHMLKEEKLEEIQAWSNLPCLYGVEERENFVDIFLGGSDTGEPVIADIDNWEHEYSDSSWSFISFCVIESGKRLVLPDRCDREKAEAIRPKIQALEKERRYNLTLQKLCRLEIRNFILEKNTNMHKNYGEERDFYDATDDIVSLYLDGHLSKNLEEFLLFREKPNGLYSRVMAYTLNKHH